MSQKRLLISAAIIALIIVMGFVISVPHTAPDTAPAVVLEAAPVIPAVTLRDSVKKGVHTITGSLEAPNACSTVTATSALTGDASTTPSIAVALTLSTGEGVCLQLPTRMSFTTSIEAPSGAPITVTVNGSVASTTTS